jgi:hypothetical protein
MEGHVKTIQDVVEAFGGLRWTVEVDEKGDGFAYSVLGGSKKTGEIYVLACIQNAVTPRHAHPGGERIGTFAGELHDRDESGDPVTIGPKQIFEHGAGSVHAPRADFWFGFYHQPRGSRLVAEGDGEGFLA